MSITSYQRQPAFINLCFYEEFNFLNQRLTRAILKPPGNGPQGRAVIMAVFHCEEMAEDVTILIMPLQIKARPHLVIGGPMALKMATTMALSMATTIVLRMAIAMALKIAITITIQYLPLAGNPLRQELAALLVVHLHPLLTHMDPMDVDHQDILSLLHMVHRLAMVDSMIVEGEAVMDMGIEVRVEDSGFIVSRSFASTTDYWP